MKGYARRMVPDDQRNELISEYLPMARRIALRVARRVPEWLSRDDLISAATVGLVEAAERYDVERVEPFAAFAERRVRGAVIDELRRGDVLPRRVRARASQIGKTIRLLEHRLARRPDDAEIAEELGVTLENYQEELKGQVHLSLVHLDLSNDRVTQLHSHSDDSPASHAAKAMLVRRVREALPRLEERDARILSLYYEGEFTYKEIGQVLEISESRVCQLHARALTRLRAEIDSIREERNG